MDPLIFLCVLYTALALFIGWLLDDSGGPDASV